MTSLTLVLVATTLAAQPPAVGAEKKLIQFGWCMPTTQWLRENAERADEAGFDGVVLDLGPGKRKLAWHAWSTAHLDPALYQGDVENLKATQFKKLTEIFIRFNVTPGKVDWFEDFGGVLHNAGIAAKIVKECRLQGILFDVEQYHGKPFHYGSQKHREERTFEEYQKQARHRGRELMRAINEQCPEIVVFLTFGHYLAHGRVSKHNPLSTTGYGLLPSFLDGMIEACTDTTTIVDGWEYAYGYKRERNFREAYDIIRTRTLGWTAVPERYKLIMRAGFGLWADRGGHKHWDTRDFSNNYFTPEELEYALHCALNVSDKYVWIYSHAPNWWTGENLPMEYLSALRNARGPHPEPPIFRSPPTPEKRIISAKTRPDHNDKATFGDLWDTYEEVGPVPVKWKFRTDPKEAGERERWFAANHDDSGWQEIDIGDWWEPQGVVYDGIAWYRVRLPIPAATKGRKLHLFLGAVDESAWVYVNGKLAKEHDLGEYGWKTRFSVELTDRVKAGEESLIAVRVLDRVNYGGIWKSVKLVAEK